MPASDNLKFMNMDKISPLQRKEVARLIGNSCTDSNIKKIIIFGSSVTARCTPHSDIDVYFELERPTRRLPRIDSMTAFDKWTNYNVDQGLMNEINQKGVLVYER